MNKRDSFKEETKTASDDFDGVVRNLEASESSATKMVNGLSNLLDTLERTEKAFDDATEAYKQALYEIGQDEDLMAALEEKGAIVDSRVLTVEKGEANLSEKMANAWELK